MPKPEDTKSFAYGITTAIAVMLLCLATFAMGFNLGKEQGRKDYALESLGTNLPAPLKEARR